MIVIWVQVLRTLDEARGATPLYRVRKDKYGFRQSRLTFIAATGFADGGYGWGGFLRHLQPERGAARFVGHLPARRRTNRPGQLPGQPGGVPVA